MGDSVGFVHSSIQKGNGFNPGLLGEAKISDNFVISPQL
jgi:hypothetical protein